MRSNRELCTPFALVVAISTSCCVTPEVKPEDYTLIATDFVGGLNFIDGDVLPALAADGEVAFVGTQALAGTPQAIFLGSGGPLTIVATQTAGFSNVSSVQHAAAGDVVFVGEHLVSAIPMRGVFRTDETGSSFATVLEGRASWLPGDAEPAPPRAKPLAMSPGGMVAFHSITDGHGGLQRVPPAGSPELLLSGSGTFYNGGHLAMHIDVNDAGAVALQLEYGDPNGGLRRGMFVFDAPGESLATIESTVMRQSVGFQPPLAINNLGQMAFAVNGPTTIQYFDPPLPAGGAMAGTQTLDAGVYLATPAPFGTPFTFVQIAAATDGYSSFGRVDVNDAGVVVFEAVHGGESGIFSGKHPVEDRIAITGHAIFIDGQQNFFSVVHLGQLNNLNQLAIQTSDFYTTDQRIWRIQVID